jgi:transcriptional regulator
VYQPAHGRFVVADPAAVLSELSAGSPATLVTMTDAGFWTTVLPMLFYPDEGVAGVLRGHLARGNPQWREQDEGGSAIAIWTGPDAYVSPAWYEEKRLTGKVVPTWNYTAVIAHGTLTTRSEPDWLLAHVRRLVERHESGRDQPWSVDDPPAGYVETQVRAIVGLELRIERIEAKRKLSQNRSAEDIEGVIDALAGSSSAEDRAVAGQMELHARRGAEER